MCLVCSVVTGVVVFVDVDVHGLGEDVLCLDRSVVAHGSALVGIVVVEAVEGVGVVNNVVLVVVNGAGVVDDVFIVVADGVDVDLVADVVIRVDVRVVRVVRRSLHG